MVFEVPAVDDRQVADGDWAFLWVESGAFPVVGFELEEEGDEPASKGVDGGDIAYDWGGAGVGGVGGGGGGGGAAIESGVDGGVFIEKMKGWIVF